MTAHDSILLYHRVADVSDDPWQLAVTPEHFEEHLVVLANEVEVVRLPEMLNPPARSGRTRVAITFDDGYRDVFTNALPLLSRYGLPATVMLVSDLIGCEQEFYWDELERVCLDDAVRMNQILDVAGSFGIEPRSRGPSTANDTSDVAADWTAYDRVLPNARHDLWRDIVLWARGVSPAAREGLLEALRRLPRAKQTPRPKTSVRRWALS